LETEHDIRQTKAPSVFARFSYMHARALCKRTSQKKNERKRTDKEHDRALGLFAAPNRMNEENIENDFYFYA
jgi:hypothetical protein